MLRSGSIILLCATLAACTQPPDPRGVGRNEVLLQVEASGRTEARPDEARFTAGVQTLAASAGAASAANAAAMNRVVSAVEAAGVARDDVQTRSITLSRIDYGADRGRFQANNVVMVRVRNLERAAAAIAAATDAGANVLSGPDLRVSDPERADRVAYASAYKSARARAEAYAAAAGLKVARVLAIRDAGASGGPVPYYGDMMEMAAQVRTASPPPMRPGMNATEVRVRADFALAED